MGKVGFDFLPEMRHFLISSLKSELQTIIQCHRINCVEDKERVISIHFLTPYLRCGETMFTFHTSSSLKLCPTVILARL